MTCLQPPSSSQLYIIGNGFDLYHWQKTLPNTSYNAFAAFLKQNHRGVFDILCQTCFLPSDTTDKLWGDFETTLADFEAEEIYDKVRDYINSKILATINQLPSPPISKTNNKKFHF